MTAEQVCITKQEIIEQAFSDAKSIAQQDDMGVGAWRYECEKCPFRVEIKVVPHNLSDIPHKIQQGNPTQGWETITVSGQCPIEVPPQTSSDFSI